MAGDRHAAAPVRHRPRHQLNTVSRAPRYPSHPRPSGQPRCIASRSPRPAWPGWGVGPKHAPSKLDQRRGEVGTGRDLTDLSLRVAEQCIPPSHPSVVSSSFSLVIHSLVVVSHPLCLVEFGLGPLVYAGVGVTEERPQPDPEGDWALAPPVAHVAVVAAGQVVAEEPVVRAALVEEPLRDRRDRDGSARVEGRTGEVVGGGGRTGYRRPVRPSEAGASFASYDPQWFAPGGGDRLPKADGVA